MHAVYKLSDDTIIEYRDKLPFDVTNKRKINAIWRIPYRGGLKYAKMVCIE